jgi:peroxiredoxin
LLQRFWYGCHESSLLTRPAIQGFHLRLPYVSGFSSAFHLNHRLIYVHSEILAFNDALAQFKELNTAVFGIYPPSPNISLHLILTPHSTSSGVSTDSKFSHFAWSTQTRKEGGLGPNLELPLIADRNMTISRDYGVLIQEEGIALRGLFIIDPKGTLRQITVNDLPVGRSVDETLRLIKAFQFTVRSDLTSFFIFQLIIYCAIRINTARSAPPTGTRAPRPSRPTRSGNWNISALFLVRKTDTQMAMELTVHRRRGLASSEAPLICCCTSCSMLFATPLVKFAVAVPLSRYCATVAEALKHSYSQSLTIIDEIRSSWL